MSCCEKFKQSVLAESIEHLVDGKDGEGYYLPWYDWSYGEAADRGYSDRISFCPFCGVKK